MNVGEESDLANVDLLLALFADPGSVASRLFDGQGLDEETVANANENRPISRRPATTFPSNCRQIVLQDHLRVLHRGAPPCKCTGSRSACF